MPTTPTSDPAPEGATLLAARGLRVGYGGRAVLPPLDLTVRRGEVWALVGRNGSGKTTLMRTLLGLLPRVGGTVSTAPGAALAYVPQRGDYDLTVPARVLDMVRGGADRGRSFLDPRWVRRHAPAIARAARDTEVEALLPRPFAELSEGQKQRVLVARALVGDPDLLVLDEPTSAMDHANEGALFDLVVALVRERRLAVLIASHQLGFVPDHATHVVLVDGDDDLALAGPVDEVFASVPFQARYGRLLGRPRAAAAAEGADGR